MTYEVDIFCDSNGLDLPAVVRRFVQSAGSRNAQMPVSDIGPEGSLWTFEVGGDGICEPITMVIRHGPAAVELQVEHARARHGAPDLSRVDLVVQLLLGDQINDDALTLIWTIFVDEFSGIPYDEMEGFRAAL
jgi:hypothetical protein